METLGDGKNITTVEDKEIVLTDNKGQQFKMKITDLAEAVRQVMQVATCTSNGLMPSSSFFQAGMFHDLNTIGSYFGYAYAELDGSGISGPYISISSIGYCLQIKADTGGSAIKYRVYDNYNKKWNVWRLLSFT